jgi:hypothetical protein
MKTIRDELTKLEHPYNELAISRTSKTMLNGPCTALAPLEIAFTWGKTPEGHHFWSEVSKGLKPELPQQSLQDLWYGDYTINLYKLTKYERRIIIISAIFLICIIVLAICEIIYLLS